MDRKLTSNFIYNLIYQFLTIALPVITIPYVSRVLGPSGIGEYNYVNSIVSYFGIVAVLGTVQYGQREISRAQFDVLERSKRFWKILFFRLTMTAIIFGAYTIFVCLIFHKYHALFIANYCTVLSWALDVSWYFQGVENFRVTAVRNAFVKIIATICIFVFVKNYSDLLLYTLIGSLSSMLGNLTMIPFLRGQIKIIKVKIVEVIRVMSGSLVFFVPIVAIQIYNTLNKIILGTFSTTKEVGYYSQALQIISVANGIIYSLSAVLLPRLSYLFDQKKINKLKDVMFMGIQNVFLMGMPMTVGLVMVADIFVPIFFGNGYKPVIIILYILSLMFIIVGIGQLLGVYLLSINRQIYNTISVIIAAFVNIFGIFLVMKIRGNAIDVSIVAVLTELSTTIYQMLSIRDYLNIRVYISAFVKYILPCLLMVISILLVRFTFRNSVAELILSILVAVMVYFAYLFIKRDNFVISLLGTLRKK